MRELENEEMRKWGASYKLAPAEGSDERESVCHKK